MINALKKKFAQPSGSNNHIGQNAIRTGGVNPINSELQKKYSHGVNFNMKVVIKGDRAAGKTSLYQRLQGQAFNENYVPTDEIQVSSILWNYRTSDYIVKLDIWDVCDASSRRTTKKIDGLKLDNNSQPSTSVDPDLMICDATFIDVYKNCNGVLLIFDVTKQWTWQYVCKELDKIPSAIPILVCANKIDLDKQREVHDEEILTFLSNYKRKDFNGRLKAPIRFTNLSTKNNHGLKFIYHFLNLPFLFLQREYLEKSLESNQKEIDIAQYELDCHDRNVDSPVDKPNGQPITTTEEAGNSNQPNGIKLKRHPSNSSTSGDENAVNMFEEDFDSADECHKTIAASKPTSKLALPPQTEEMLTSFNEILDTNASIAEELSESLNLDSDVQPTETPQKLESPEEKLDSWLDDVETKEPEKLSGRRLSSSSSSSGDVRQNPLVAKFGGSDEDDSDSQLQSHGSTSCSTIGYSNSPRIKSESKHPKFKAPSALEDFLSIPQNSSEHKETKVKSKKKTKKVGEKSTKKKSSSKKNASSNILIEDEHPVEVSADQYDPL